MPELRQVCDRIEAEISGLREKIGARSWGDFSRKGFVYNLENMLPGLEGLYTQFQVARNIIDKSAEAGRPETAEHLMEMGKLISVLKKNLELEHGRLEKSRERGIQAIAETITVPELYSDLEQKTSGILLKSSYLVERIRVFERKKEPMMQAKGAQRNVLDLLEKRENELAELRKKYEDTRKNTFLGLVEKESSNDVEAELNEISRKLEAKTSLMKKALEAKKGVFEQMQRQMAELEARISEVEELEGQSLGKTFELITMLKKERDYAKRILAEIEHETIQLRNTYSKELLNLQEEKMGMKNALEEKYSRDSFELRKELKQKNELLDHFRDAVQLKEKKILELEEKNEKLHLLARTLEKHGKIRERFAGKKSERRGKKSAKKSKS